MTEKMFHVEHRKMDYHLHTLHSMDGRQSMDELCARMVSLGVDEISLTEHIEPGHPDPNMDLPPIWDVWFHEINEMRKKYPSLTIRAGVEIGDNPPLHDRIVKTLDALPLDFRLLSMHLADGIDCYEPEYFQGKTRDQAYRRYAECKAESILMWEDFDSIAHIGYVAKYSPFMGEEKPLRYEDAPDAFDALLKHVIDLDKCIEINTSGYGATGDTLPHSSIIRRYIDLGGDTFTFGSDSHDVDRDYADIERAKEQVKALGGKYQASFCQRKMERWKL